jgi:uncharacterized membrane protein YgdD (TMEM256/DUF423 family)
MKSQYKYVLLRCLLVATAILFLAVVLGAFGAHALEKILTEKQLANWQTAIDYMVIHAFALIVVAFLMNLLPKKTKTWQRAGQSFLLGIILFSGSLIAWSLTSYTPLVIFTPIGGTLFLVGWSIVFVGLLKAYRD